MKINLVKINKKEKDTLSKMMTVYQQELLCLDNPGEYKYLHLYFENVNYHPYFIKVDKEIIGFVLVNNYSVIEKNCYSIAEFYVKKEYRNRNIGKIAAIKVFNLYPGKWEIRELKKSTKAHEFWVNVINKYTNGNFKEINLDNEQWKGPVQLFRN